MEKLSLHLNLLTSFPLSLLSFHKVWFLLPHTRVVPIVGSELTECVGCMSIDTGSCDTSICPITRSLVLFPRP